MKSAQPTTVYFVYMLECADGTYYTGSTNDVERRVLAHNAGKTGAKYTRSRLPVRLVYMEGCGDKSAAMKREAEIKQMSRSGKHALVHGDGMTH
ncbi:GIY-YIG nuclease family protein [Candidatus Kaiserbacteria bacterium]|nr:GIY-YIG nuclease family protein [Candidatus Kaiserbacteria bacterium]